MGDEKDTGNNKKDLVQSVFSDTGAFFVFLYKKTERLVSALYVVTSLLPKDEPLRGRIRHTSVSLLGEVLPLKDNITRNRVKKKVLPLLSELHSLITVGTSAELFSEMNKALLDGELENLVSFLTGELEERAQELYLPEGFFDVNVQPSDKKLGDSSDTPQSKGHKRTSKGHSKNSALASSSSMDETRQRRVRIRRVLERGGKYSVRDICEEVTGYSEKTVQRDLAWLEKKGVVKREGKRRWTRYTLA